MIYFGGATPTSVPGVHLMGPGLKGAAAPAPALVLGATATAWVRQGKPYDSQECRTGTDGKLQCRPYGAAGVKALQSALKTLAQTSGNTQFDPKQVDGTIGVNTRLALGLAINAIAGTFTSSAKYVFIPLAGLLIAGTETGDALVRDNADELAAAISVAAMRLAPVAPVVDPNAGGGGGYAPAATGPAWYTTTNGKIALGAGAALILLLVLKK